MAKFSAGGDDDGEGPSNPTQKRRRITVSRATVGDDERQAIGNQCGTEDEREDIVQGLEVLQSEEDPCNDNSGNCFGAGSSDSGEDNNVSAPENWDRSISVTLSDPDVFDCCICYEPLSIPIFQCENGHIACSSCCVKLGNKCPLCSMPIGYNRCRAIEKVLESVKISCLNAQYGCKETITYSKKNEHEKQCIYAPCTCPQSGCNFVAPSKVLSFHFLCKHGVSARNFTYNCFFSIFLRVNDEVIVLQEQNGADLFMLKNKVGDLGNMVNVSCICPNLFRKACHYDILVRSQGCCLKIHCLAENIRGGKAINTAPTGFLLIPSCFFGSSGQLKLDIRIKCN
ncbi:hypothetical protein K1719_006403 [Acacia pycnantha]|nr:hypothetical protein K1719_006403 [Acacia pycnantha]